MALVNFVKFLVLKILGNLFFMQNSLKKKTKETADINKKSRTFQRDLTFILNVLSDSSIHFS